MRTEDPAKQWDETDKKSEVNKKLNNQYLISSLTPVTLAQVSGWEVISITNNGSPVTQYNLIWAPVFVFNVKPIPTVENHFPDEEQIFGYEPSSVDEVSPESEGRKY